MVVVVAFLIVFCLFLLFLLRQQYLKATKAENLCSAFVDSLGAIQEIIAKANEDLNQSPNLKIAFENDDETGIYFSELEKIQDQLNQFLVNEQETSSGEQS